MSSPKNDEWPELGELVVATVSRISEHGAYVMLDEYEKEGFLHISEISSSWVRNIRDAVREGEKVVLKVMRVDPERKHIDLSLRRVTSREKRDKLLLWKRSKKADGLFRTASQRLGTSLEEIYERTGTAIEKSFGDTYEGLEKAAREGPEVLVEKGVPKDLAETLAIIAKEKIKIRVVRVRGTLSVTCTKPSGVLLIKDALLKAKNLDIPRGTDVKIHVISPPRYRIEVTASEYKEANTILKKASEVALDTMAKSGGQGTFKGD